MSARPQRPFGPSRTTTIVTVSVLSLLLYGLIVVLSLPLSGGWLQSAGWSALSIVVVPLFNKKLRAMMFDRLAEVSLSRRSARRRRLASSAVLAPAPVAASPQAAPPAATASVAATPGPGAPARPVAPVPPDAPDLATTRQAVPAAAVPEPAPPRALPLAGFAAQPPAVDLAATTAGVAAALAAALPPGCSVRADAVQAVVWNSVATTRAALGVADAAARSDPHTYLTLAATRLLDLAASFVAEHGMTSWPPSDLRAVPAVSVSEHSVRAWYEHERRPVLVLAEVPLVRGGPGLPGRAPGRAG